MFEAKKTLTLLFSFCLLGLILVNIWGHCTLKQNEAYEKIILKVSKRLNSLSRLEAENKGLINLYKSADPAYIHSSLESLRLTPSSAPIHFIEKGSERNLFYRETKEKLARRITVDFDDLKKILSLIEHQDGSSSTACPHLIISDFTLKKNNTLGDNFYSLDLELLKRDYQP